MIVAFSKGFATTPAAVDLGGSPSGQPLPSSPAPWYRDRGMRNYNPGNIKRGSSNWQGMLPNQGNDPVFVQFYSMPAGIRASLKLLLKYYYDYDLRNVHGIVNRWSATDKSAYINFVSDCYGADPFETIPGTEYSIKKLASCVFDFENRFAKPTQSEINTAWSIL